jgi:hypothetical protein
LRVRRGGRGNPQTTSTSLLFEQQKKQLPSEKLPAKSLAQQEGWFPVVLVIH